MYVFCVYFVYAQYIVRKCEEERRLIRYGRLTTILYLQLVSFDHKNGGISTTNHVTWIYQYPVKVEHKRVEKYSLLF